MTEVLSRHLPGPRKSPVRSLWAEALVDGSNLRTGLSSEAAFQPNRTHRSARRYGLVIE